jgi:hypothetical protein
MTGWTFRTFATSSSGPMPKNILFWNGRLIIAAPGSGTPCEIGLALRERGRGHANVLFRTRRRLPEAQLPMVCCSFSIAWSIVNVAGRWLGGNSSNVARNLATPA